ncbi:hypothetical protein K5X82_04680 [Halosquirtibacter xylanolyticus]|uniref:hypothetical protein n=1 Tax=Halosquirtibacter xylanolyticus TaxID=3374599 RepID=UPI003748D8A4|nr:hypothetical protein K5X82_04680 [Prolixibacteraceae bacterium]
MKRSTVFFFILSLYVFSTSMVVGQAVVKQSVIKKAYSSVTTKKYKALERFGKMERAQLIGQYALKYRFDSKGDTIESSRYQMKPDAKQGDIDTIAIVRYNDRGQKIEENTFTNKGAYGRYDYFYHENGTLKLVNQYDQTGKKVNRSDYYYDGQRRLIRMLRRGFKGDTLRYDQYQYFQSGTYIQKAKLYKEDAGKEVTYSFDKAQRVFEKKYYFKKALIKSVFLSYDLEGHLISQNIKKKDKPTIHIRYQYDDHGMLIYQRELDTSTKKAEVKRFQYFYDKTDRWVHRYVAIEKIEGFFSEGYIEDREYHEDGTGDKTVFPVSYH